jgi:general secretion pathway protein E
MNCPHCATPYAPDQAELASAHLHPEEVGDYLFMRGKGCGDCRGTGYKGRRSIAEILTLNDEIRELIVDKQPIRRIKAAAAANGTRSLRMAALDLVKRGATTIEEIKRVTLHA